jgi:uncharacterized protein
MAKKQIFIYHGNCPDGFTAAWVFDKFRDPRIDGTVEYFAARYGDDPPDCKGKEVWMVDFSYPRDVMIEKVFKPSARTIVMDHHKTAEAALKDIQGELRDKHRLQRDTDKVIFDMHRSGSGILYDELRAAADRKNGIKTPAIGGRALWLVDYIEDRDLWKNALPDTELVSAYLFSLPMTFESWNAVSAMRRVDVAEGGRAIKRYIDTFGEKVCAMARFEEIDGTKIPTINTPYMNCSDHVGRLSEMYPDAPYAAGYFRRADAQWQFSLRTRNGSTFDVSELAKKFGGGGHRAAAGFTVERLPWEKTAA